jgi:AcrR family transcriptional regulator
MSARSYHHGNLRSALLEHAERTVREEGVQALSLRELAREIGVSHGAPRRHFADRQALLDALAENGFERLGEVLAEAVRDGSAGFEARLQALAHAYVGFAVTHQALVELMFAGKHREGAERTRVAAEQAIAVPLSVIAEAQHAGELVPGDPELINAVAFATLHGLATMANNDMVGADDLDAVVTYALDRLLSGLRPR